MQKTKGRDHYRSYREYKKEGRRSNVEFGKDSALKYVAVADILSITYSRPDWNENTPDFWYHHSKTPEDYDNLANKYQIVREKIKAGASLRFLKTHNDLKRIIDWWWSKKDSVRLVKFKNSYFVVNGHHRVALAMKHCIDEVPAIVSIAKLKKGV